MLKSTEDGVLVARHRAKSSGSKQSGPSGNSIFNRVLEVKFLEKTFEREPDEVVVLVGPKNSGKTKILQEVKIIRETAQATKGEGPPPVLYLDCRRKGVGSPLLFSTNLRELVTEDVAMDNWWKNLSNLISASIIKLPYYHADLKTFFKLEESTKSPIGGIIDSLTAFLEATRPLSYKPVIIIDEANVVMEWKEQDKGHAELKKLLRFFVRVTKQEHLAHIVLATSDYFLTTWLENEGLDSEQYSLEVIGDLAGEFEAKEYMKYLIKIGTSPQSLIETGVNGQQIDMWPKVYEVCGGNIGLLKRCAGKAAILGSWEEGLKSIIKVPAGAVAKGLHPEDLKPSKGSRSPPAWTSDQCKTVYRKIARAKHHAVSREDLRAAIGATALLSMLEWNLVALRPQSGLAKDLTADVFSKEGETVVTMPSAVNLYSVMTLDRAGELEETKTKD